MAIVHLGMRKLTPKGIAIIDEIDVEAISQYNWSSVSGRYAQARVDGRTVTMHVFIMGRKGVDHINGNGLDNRRINLRFATVSQNAMNMKSKTGSSSRYKGVMWESDRQKWVARIKVDGVYRNLGRFDDEVEAARTYDRAAAEHYGEYARLNLSVIKS